MSTARIDESADAVARILESGRTVYGVNTGFGLLAQTRIPDDRLAELQRNLILSHCCGLGAILPDRIVRLMLALKVNGLARGHSGVRRMLVHRLLVLLAGGRAAGNSLAGFGRRVGRPGPARPSRRAADRRRQPQDRRRGDAGDRRRWRGSGSNR